MHFGPKNPGIEYTMITERNKIIELKSTRVERDLNLRLNLRI